MKSFIDSSLLQTDGIISNKYAPKCMPRLLFKGVGEEEICAYISKELCLEMCPNSSLHLSKNRGILYICVRSLPLLHLNYLHT